MDNRINEIADRLNSIIDEEINKRVEKITGERTWRRVFQNAETDIHMQIENSKTLLNERKERGLDIGVIREESRLDALLEVQNTLSFYRDLAESYERENED